MPSSQAIHDEKYMRLALQQARRSPPKPSNFCVGAVLVSPSSAEPVLATGYTLEMPGNTHAEQSAFLKLAGALSLGVEAGKDVEPELGRRLPLDTILYTTMEPCNKRSVGNLPCVDRVLRLQSGDGAPAVRRVCVGVPEPETFVGVNEGRKRLEDAGIEFVVVRGFEKEILETATSGHDKA